MLRSSGISTADTVAAIRAIHQRERVRIFKDPYAGILCGWFWRLVLRISPVGMVGEKGHPAHGANRPCAC